MSKIIIKGTKMEEIHFPFKVYDVTSKWFSLQCFMNTVLTSQSTFNYP